MKYFYTDEFGKICSCTETGASEIIPESAIKWPDDMDFSKAMDWHFNKKTNEFAKIDLNLSPSNFHRFNIENMKWEYQPLFEEQFVRDLRNSKLFEIDMIATNPIRWASLSDAVKNEYANYRKSLLDVPQQEGFPSNVIWPTPPQG